MKNLLRINLFALVLLSPALGQSSQDVDEKAAITGSAVDAANDFLLIRDASVPTGPALKKLTIGDVINVPGFFGSVSSTELGYMDGVTSAIQTQIDGKLGTSATAADVNPAGTSIAAALAGKQATITDGTLTIARTSGLQAALDAKHANSMSTNKLLGRGTAGTGTIEEITLGTNLSFSGTTLNAAGGGTVDNAGVNTAIGENVEATRLKLDLATPVEFSHRLNTQPHVLKRILNYGSNTNQSKPIRILRWGDSFLGGVEPPPNAALSGRFNLAPVASTTVGTITPLTNETSTWINKAAIRFEAGSSASMCLAASLTNWETGDRVGIGYLKRSGGGTFDIEYETSQNIGTWVPLATVNTANASTIGAYEEFTLPTSNNPYFRLRISNVTAQFTLITLGVFCNDGGGVIWLDFAAPSGFSPSEINVPSAIFDPIWAGLAPDCVMTSFLENGGTQWDAGGGFRNFYNAAKTAFPATDWVLIGPHYCIDDPSTTDAIIEDQVRGMRNFCLEENHSFFDSRGMFRTWAESNALGLMDDGIHPSYYGDWLRFYQLWHTLPMSKYPLGQLENENTSEVEAVAMSRLPGNLRQKAIAMSRPLHITSGNDAIAMSNTTTPLDFRKSGRLRTANSPQPHALSEVQLGVNGGWSLGVSEQLVRFSQGVAMQPPSNYTATATIYRSPYTATCDATAGNMTLNFGVSAADSPGRLHVIKKLDATANTVTVDPAGSELIDGAATFVLTSQWQTIQVQSTGTGWLIIAKF